MKIKKEDEIQFRASRINGISNFWYVIEWRKKPHNWLHNVFNVWRDVFKYRTPILEYDNPADQSYCYHFIAEPDNVSDILTKFKEYKTYGDLYDNVLKYEYEKYDNAVKAYNKYWENHHKENVIY